MGMARGFIVWTAAGLAWELMVPHLDVLYMWTQQTAMMQYSMSFKFRLILVNVTQVVYFSCSHLSFIDVFPKRICKSVNLILGPYRRVPSPHAAAEFG